MYGPSPYMYGTKYIYGIEHRNIIACEMMWAVNGKQVEKGSGSLCKNITSFIVWLS